MLRISNIKLSIDHTEGDLVQALCGRLSISPEELLRYDIRKQSVDARKKRHGVFFIYTVDVTLARPERHVQRLLSKKLASPAPDRTYRLPARAPRTITSRPIIVGTGPCGLLAGLLLAEMGFCPLLLERGRPAGDRAGDVSRFWREGTLDPTSNVQFGEGGAGTFSDGKLTTQIKDRQNRVRKVLEEFVRAGAPEEILYQSKPHVGTDLLITMVKRMRERIIMLGGEVRFQSLVTGLIPDSGRICGVVLESGEEIESPATVLAIGHSARDTFSMLEKQNVLMEQKPFSIGCRIEHPQSLIDQTQYGGFAGHPRLGPADYRLVHHASTGHAAYTFCMCPGGQVIGSSSEPGGVVTNGMSVHARNRTNANAALLVGVSPEMLGSEHVLAGMEYQRKWERRAFDLAGGTYHAPTQLVEDFLHGRPSRRLGDVSPSYTPGVALTDLALCLPEYVTATLRESITALDGKLKGFARPDAVLTGVETRSSSPVRILRDGNSLQSPTLPGLYPAGEGAGYAGGIVSAAVDGIRTAEAVALTLGTPIV
jgi:hypothetical protein